MFWNEAIRCWQEHPLCTCHRTTWCTCSNLPPLDAYGKPLGPHGALGPNYPTPAIGALRAEKFEDLYGA